MGLRTAFCVALAVAVFLDLLAKLLPDQEPEREENSSGGE